MITHQTLRQALRARKEFAASPGLALRVVLNEAVEKLKPAGDAREDGRQSRSYTILRKQYLGRPDALRRC